MQTRASRDSDYARQWEGRTMLGVSDKQTFLNMCLIYGVRVRARPGQQIMFRRSDLERVRDMLAVNETIGAVG